MLLGSGGRRSVCLWLCRLLSVPSGDGIAEAKGHVARRCFGTKWYSDVPGEYPRYCDTGNEDISFAGFLNSTSSKPSKRCAGRMIMEINDYHDQNFNFSCITLRVVLFFKTVVSRPQGTFCYLIQSSGSDPRGEAHHRHRRRQRTGCTFDCKCLIFYVLFEKSIKSKFRFSSIHQTELFEVRNSKNFLGRGSHEPPPQTPPPLFLGLRPRFGLRTDSDPPYL